MSRSLCGRGSCRASASSNARPRLQRSRFEAAGQPRVTNPATRGPRDGVASRVAGSQPEIARRWSRNQVPRRTVGVGRGRVTPGLLRAGKNQLGGGERKLAAKGPRWWSAALPFSRYGYARESPISSRKCRNIERPCCQSKPIPSKSNNRIGIEKPRRRMPVGSVWLPAPIR